MEGEKSGRPAKRDCPGNGASMGSPGATGGLLEEPRNGSRSAVDVESDPAGASASGGTAGAATKASGAMSQRVFMKAGRDPAAAGSGPAGQPGWCARCRDPSGDPHSRADHGVCRRERGAVARAGGGARPGARCCLAASVRRTRRPAADAGFAPFPSEQTTAVDARLEAPPGDRDGLFAIMPDCRHAGPAGESRPGSAQSRFPESEGAPGVVRGGGTPCGSGNTGLASISAGQPSASVSRTGRRERRKHACKQPRRPCAPAACRDRGIEQARKSVFGGVAARAWRPQRPAKAFGRETRSSEEAKPARNTGSKPVDRQIGRNRARRGRFRGRGRRRACFG